MISGLKTYLSDEDRARMEAREREIRRQLNQYKVMAGATLRALLAEHKELRAKLGRAA